MRFFFHLSSRNSGSDFDYPPSGFSANAASSNPSAASANFSDSFAATSKSLEELLDSATRGEASSFSALDNQKVTRVFAEASKSPGTMFSSQKKSFQNVREHQQQQRESGGHRRNRGRARRTSGGGESSGGEGSCATRTDFAKKAVKI